MSVRTSAADVNFLSCSNGVWGLNEGSDHAQTLSTLPDPLDLMPADPQSYSAILKTCDNTQGIAIPAPGTGLISIAQGSENAVDLNNYASNIAVSAHFGAGGGVGDQVLTIKGGCRDCRFAGFIHSQGRNADIVIDAYSDQSAELCSGIDLSRLTRADSQPVTIILGRFGSKVDRYPPSYKVLFWKSLGYSVYWIAKRAAVKLSLFGGSK